jgi:hypothetical protein
MTLVLLLIPITDVQSVLWLSNIACHFLKVNPYQMKFFDLIHCDIWGPFSTDSLNGVKYLFTNVDDYSRVICVHLMVTKSQTINLLTSIINLVETQFDSKVKSLRSDNGFEFQMPFFFINLRVLFIN